VRPAEILNALVRGHPDRERAFRELHASLTKRAAFPLREPLSMAVYEIPEELREDSVMATIETLVKLSERMPIPAAALGDDAAARWLETTLVRKGLSAIRKRAPEILVEEPREAPDVSTAREEPEIDPDGTTRALRAELERLLRRTLAEALARRARMRSRLEADFEELLALSFGELTIAEALERSGVSHDAALKRHQRCRDELLIAVDRLLANKELTDKDAHRAREAITRILVRRREKGRV